MIHKGRIGAHLEHYDMIQHWYPASFFDSNDEYKKQPMRVPRAPRFTLETSVTARVHFVTCSSLDYSSYHQVLV